MRIIGVVKPLPDQFLHNLCVQQPDKNQQKCSLQKRDPIACYPGKGHPGRGQTVLRFWLLYRGRHGNCLESKTKRRPLSQFNALLVTLSILPSPRYSRTHHLKKLIGATTDVVYRFYPLDSNHQYRNGALGDLFHRNADSHGPTISFGRKRWHPYPNRRRTQAPPGHGPHSCRSSDPWIRWCRRKR